MQAVVVIGAGAVGLATAWELGKLEKYTLRHAFLVAIDIAHANS